MAEVTKEISIRATREELVPYLDSITAMDPEITVEVYGPSEVGVCLVTVMTPISKDDDVDMVFAAFNRDYPGTILMNFKE